MGVRFAIPLLVHCAVSATGAFATETLWAIGERDDQSAEFALGPDRYGDYDADGYHVVGVGDPASDWPYTHPGPADTWAGGTAHTFTVVFVLEHAVTGKARLVIDLLDTHSERPPTFTIKVNDRSWTHECPPGGGDASIFGSADVGQEHVIEVPIPEGVLTQGANTVEITNSALSWVVYDWVGLETDASLVVSDYAMIRGVEVDPWLTRANGTLGQLLTIDLLVLDETSDLALQVGSRPPIPVVAQGNLCQVELRLPPARARKRATVKLLQDGKEVDRRRVTRGRAREREPVDYVDCLIGTSTSRWMLYPGPSMPFGMVKLSPDNQEQGWKAGYEYTIGNIAGFSHIHAWTMGGLLTMPTVGELRTQPGGQSDPDGGYRSRIRHETEVAVPGYYAVTLEDYGIRAELTSTTRAGMQRYTFPEAEDARLLLDLKTPTEYGYEVLDANIARVSDTEIEGYSKHQAGSWAPFNEYTVHFVARLSRPFDRMGGWVGGTLHGDVSEIAGEGDVGCFLSFETSADEQVLLQTGISLVSIDQARLNLDAEMGAFGWDFDAVRRAGRDVWSELLGTIEVEGEREADKVKFYTNLYRSYAARTIWSDTNGKYVDMYEKVQQLPDPGSPVYGCDAFWNTFWNLNQLWVLASPETADRWVRSLLEIYDKGGWLAKGPTGIEYSSIMVASHEIPLIVAAYQAGIRGYDVATAYEAVRHCQTTPGRAHPGGGHVGNMQLGPYMEFGYVPVEDGPASNTLEYAYDDWCVAQFAEALGHEDDHAYFLGRALNYRNLYDPATGYVRQRHRNGDWVEGFSPYDGRGFVEGNSWQYTWFVPQDVGGLIALMGVEEFNARLDAGLEASRKNRFNATGDRMADFPINHGNQPNMQSAWLFNYSGRPWLTQKWSREILDLYYGNGPIDGWPGDEDQGQMGAWFVMAAMGLFQMDGGCATRPVYEIGSPLFKRVVIHLNDDYYPGGRFVIEARGNSPENRYIQSANLDGRPLDRPWFYQSELVDGGTLILEMGPKPNTRWGGSLEAAPPSVPRQASAR